jgi:oxaloacetate decarboxylase beta subunit
MNFSELLTQMLHTSGFAALSWQHLVMLAVSALLMYLAIVKKFEPLLLLPISFGMLLANLPMTGLMYDATASAQAALAAAEAAGEQEAVIAALTQLANAKWYDSGILYNLYLGIRSVLFPALIFLGVGAMTDFGPMLANPKCMLIGGAAQIGIFSAFAMANLSGLFTPAQSAVIGIIGSSDGPTTIFLAGRLAPEIMGPVAVAAYSYMALVPLIQPPIMKALTTAKERAVRMEKLREVGKTERIIFPVAVTTICLLLTPATAPLIGMFMLGNLFRESGVVERLNQTAQNALINIVTILLGVTVGATTNGEIFLQLQTIVIICLGLLAFGLSTVGGVLFGKLMYYITGGKVNPLIGAAGVSAIPMAARVVQKVGNEYDPGNFLLMHAMGPSIAAVISSAIVAGFFVVLFG